MLLRMLSIGFVMIFFQGLNGPLCWAEEGPPQKVVEVLSLQKEGIRERVRLFGRVRAKLEYTHVAETDGVLDHALFAGQSLKKGQIFASLENPEVKATYELAQKTEQIALEQYQRSQTLLAQKAASQKKAEADHARWIDAKQRSIQAKISFDKTQFKAPFDGVLGVFKQREGAYLQKGDRVVTLYNPEELVVELDIPEKYVRTLSPSSQVLIEGKAYPLTHLQKVVDPETNTAPSFVDLGPSAFLIPGAVIELDLILQEKSKMLVVPIESLLIEGAHQYVYAIKEGKTVKVEVTLGIREGQRAEVKSGLSEGDIIVIKNPSRLSPDESVRLLSDVKAQETSPSPATRPTGAQTPADANAKTERTS